MGYDLNEAERDLLDLQHVERTAFKTFLLILKSINLAIEKKGVIPMSELPAFNQIITHLKQQVTDYKNFVDVLVVDNRNDVLKDPILSDIESYSTLLNNKIKDLIK